MKNSLGVIPYLAPHAVEKNKYIQTASFNKSSNQVHKQDGSIVPPTFKHLYLYYSGLQRRCIFFTHLMTMKMLKA